MHFLEKPSQHFRKVYLNLFLKYQIILTAVSIFTMKYKGLTLLNAIISIPETGASWILYIFVF